MMSAKVMGSLALGLAIVVVAGCATSDPGQRVLMRSTSAIASGVEAGTEAMESVDELQLKGRYNPCHCPAPDFEVYLRGHWQRVLIDGEQETLTELDRSARSLANRPSLGFIWMTGHLDGYDTFSETGASYASFYVEQFRIE